MDSLASSISVHPEILNESNKSNESKATKSPSAEKLPAVKNRRKRKPNITKKCLTASDMSLSENDMEGKNAVFDFDELPSSRIATSKTADSDECETIDKIAQMVAAASEPAAASTEVVNLNTSDEMIEDQLKQMFADTTATQAEVVTPPTEVVGVTELSPKKKRGPRKKKENGAAAKRKPSGIVQGKNGKLVKKKKKNVEIVDNSLPIKLKPKEHSGKSKVKADVAPFVQIQKDGSFTIVNQLANGDEDTEKAASKTKKTSHNERHKIIRGLHMSTLSNKYDAEQRDLTWICVFCKLGPHKNKSGDLFGPYIITKTSEDYKHCLQDPNNDVFRQNNKNKLMKSPPISPDKPKKKRKSNAGITVPANDEMASEEIFSGMSKVDENSFEVWLHEECLVWAPGVYMIGSKIIGMESAIWSSTRYRCAYCNLNGAMLSCLSRECRKPAHFGCARKGWTLNDEFKTFCEIHQ